MADIFVAQAGEQRGPVTGLEILPMVEKDKLPRADVWWKADMASWESLGTPLPPPLPKMDTHPAPLVQPKCPPKFIS